MADIAQLPDNSALRSPARLASLALAGVLALGLAGGTLSRQATTPSGDLLRIEGLSARQIETLIRQGRTVAVVPLTQDAAGDVARVARMLGNALITPVPGKGSIEVAARELKLRGFRAVAFLGGGEADQGDLASRLNREWRGHRVRVVAVPECCGAGTAAQSGIAAAVTRIRRALGRIDA